MKELSFETLLAVFEEIFGKGLFWAMVVIAAIITVAYLYVLVRDRHMSARKFLLAQLFMPLGAVAAVMFVLWVTNSALADIGGRGGRRVGDPGLYGPVAAAPRQGQQRVLSDRRSGHGAGG